MKQISNISIGFFAMLLFICCSSKTSEPENFSLSFFNPHEEGVQAGGSKLIPIVTPEGTFNVWTKRIGNNPDKKVLILHGGPGGIHDAYICFESFLPREGIEFIYYDQLGSGNSDNPGRAGLYDLDRYVDEVEQVRKALQLDKSNFILFGHSWGGILAMEYAVKHQENLKGLIISNMMSSAPLYEKYANDVLAPQMPKEVLDTIRMLEAKGDYANPKYMELLFPHYYAKHIYTLHEMPAPLTNESKVNFELYTIMQGPSEFGISGKLENWDRSQDLKNISTPTLVMAGKHDTMDPGHLKWMSEQFPNGHYILCENGSHFSMYDDQETYFKGLISFLKGLQ